MKKVAILQSCYIPWKGYFDLLRQVDEFILYDTAQYTTRDWRNRNCIKGKDGLQWLTIPVRKGIRDRAICEVETVKDEWAIKHWKLIKNTYQKAPEFAFLQEKLEPLYTQLSESNLSQINLFFLKHICEWLAITTPITLLEFAPSKELGKTEKLIHICQKYGADTYLTGSAAKAYLQPDLFADEKIKLEWMEYDYPPYEQLYPPFNHHVSIVDLLAHQGKNASEYIF